MTGEAGAVVALESDGAVRESAQAHMGGGADEALILPPHNMEAEQGLLGAILASSRAYEAVADFLAPHHFYNAAHGRIYGAAIALIERGQVANAVTLKNYFDHDGDLESVGGAAYLAELQANVVAPSNAGDYGRLIYDLFLRRELIDLGRDMAAEAHTHSLDLSASQQIETAEAALYRLAEEGDVSGGFLSLAESVQRAIETAEQAYKRDSHVSGCTSGFMSLDKQLGGLHPSDLLILAGRPSMGKTALATNIAWRTAETYATSNGQDGGVVAFFSLEMSAEQLAARILADVAEIPSDKIRKGEIQESDFLRFADASDRMSRVPLHIDDTPGITVGAMRSRCRRLKRTVGLGLIVVDYLQLMQSADRRVENRVQQISEITRSLKGLAKEFHVPVLALSQLSRAVEQREDKRPQLADLRESGSIEQDADVVMFVFREQYYLERAEPVQKPDEDASRFNERYERWREAAERAHNTAETIIAKQRHGPVGSVKLFFDGQYTRFDDLDMHHTG